MTLKYVTDGWGTESNGFKLVITAFKDKSEYIYENSNNTLFCHLYTIFTNLIIPLKPSGNVMYIQIYQPILSFAQKVYLSVLDDSQSKHRFFS